MIGEAVNALSNRDIEALGSLMQLSYHRMHAAMLASQPPVRYWHSGTLEVLDACAELRKEGIGAWETMDAGPQVKILCLASDIDLVAKRMRDINSDFTTLEAKPGKAPRIEVVSEDSGDQNRGIN